MHHMSQDRLEEKFMHYTTKIVEKPSGYVVCK